MPLQHNPFRPKHPIYDDAFAGRQGQLNRIDQVLMETREGNPSYLLVVGERGIGKTSLVLAAKSLAEGASVGPFSGEDGPHDFLTVGVTVGGDTTLPQFCSKVSKGLEEALASSEAAIQFLKTSWSFLQRIEIGGSKLNAAGESSTSLRDELISSIVKTVKAITNPSPATLGLRSKKHGLVLFIDEADNASSELNIGTLVKELNERLVLQGCNKVLIVLSGLPSVKDVLAESHASSPRLFDVLELEPIAIPAAQEVITKSIAMANVMFHGRHTVSITQEAVSYIAVLSGGHPQLLQQFGYSVYAADSDYFINKDDVYAGSKQATEALGKFYSDMYDSIRHIPLCEAVLAHMVVQKDEWMSYDSLAEHFNDNRTNLDNAITALLSERILVRHRGGQNQYRIQWAGLALWLKLLVRVK